ncbi:uncharacterized protein TNCT_435312 [Trichonephila clavata]|uniref:Uncharacterized protein n=1 Tax=Trichonephila clavata TaxID=2740835 RepID=A0A8X6GXI6_TRICU|nr:uncharacterized protein TNCT_435312 [Trichonephila clavata]
MQTFISLSSLVHGIHEYQTKCACVYPYNDARATRNVLLTCFIFILLGIVISLFFPFTKQETFMLACLPYVVAFFLYLSTLQEMQGLLSQPKKMKFLGRIFIYYLILKDLEATGVPFNPDVHLSFLNYLRIIAFLLPEVSTTSQTPAQNEDEAIEHDKQS